MTKKPFDLTSLEPLSREIANELIPEFRGVERKFSNDGGVLIVRWPSANAAVAADLVLNCSEIPSLWWFGGYMYDFPFVDCANTIRQFLKDFFEERIACGVELDTGKVTASGPIDVSELGFGSWADGPNVSIRSWRGTFDRD